MTTTPEPTPAPLDPKRCATVPDLTVPAAARAARASQLRATLFPDGRRFLNLPYDRQWAASERRLHLIDTEHLAADLDALHACALRAHSLSPTLRDTGPVAEARVWSRAARSLATFKTRAGRGDEVEGDLMGRRPGVGREDGQTGRGSAAVGAGRLGWSGLWLMALGAVSSVAWLGCNQDPGQGASPDVCSDGAGPCQGAGPGAAPPGFVYIPPGTFTMGSPSDEPGREAEGEDLHEVTLTHGFYMQETEVTQGAWEALMGTNPSHFSSCGADCPVERVSWWEALAYANALSVSEGYVPCYVLAPSCSGRAGDEAFTCTSVTVHTNGNDPYLCEGYRLPTGAEWEYAYRAGTRTAFYDGAITETACSPVDPIADAIAWYCGNAGDETHPVAQREANAWGLFDMAGNVWEWCWDLHQDSLGSAPVTDPVGAPSGFRRVTRGGCWSSDAQSLRGASRGSFGPASRTAHLGFRLVRSAP